MIPFDFSHSPYRQPFTAGFMRAARSRGQNAFRSHPRQPGWSLTDLLWDVEPLRDMFVEGGDGVGDGVIIVGDCFAFSADGDVEAELNRARVEDRMGFCRAELDRARERGLPVSFDFIWHLDKGHVFDTLAAERLVIDYLLEKLRVARGGRHSHEYLDGPGYCSLIVYIDDIDD